jgi:hypothetical protein
MLSMTPSSKMRVNVACAALAGLALRLFFVLRFPSTDSGDAPFYIELAWNWLKKGVYGLSINGQLTPVDMRSPGYPGFLAAVFAFGGNSQRAAMLAQVAVDLATCFVIALIAARLAPAASRRRAALAGLWLAALCPFTANYTAVVLTETLATFLTALALLVLLDANRREMSPAAPGRSLSPWFLGGIVAGFGALVRPETPLLVIAVALVLLARWFRPRDWKHLARACALMAAGLLLPLLPWAARNWRTLHDVQFLAPRYAELPGELPPLGFTAWTETWLWHFRDVYTTLWNAEVAPIPIADIPPSAFDSPAERARIADLLARYNDTLTISHNLDQQFGEIARERTARHPLRTYLRIPLLRCLTIWFTPRVELLPYSSQLWPLGDEWRYDRRDFLITLSLAAINLIYVALALAGAWLSRGRCGWALLAVFIVLRTLFFAATVDTPEPRYVLECFPAVIAFAAQVLSRPLRPAPREFSSGFSRAAKFAR